MYLNKLLVVFASLFIVLIPWQCLSADVESGPVYKDVDGDIKRSILKKRPNLAILSRTATANSHAFDFDQMEEEAVTYNKAVNNCREAPVSGIYQIKIPGILKVVHVRCEAKYLKGGWIVIQRRYIGHENFFKNWRDYKSGFGDLEREFWYGLEKIHKITKQSNHELMIVVRNVDGSKGYAKYDKFVIDSELDGYKLSSLGAFSGSLGDSLHYHLGSKFTTFDKRNHGGNIENCALTGYGAWWYRECYQSNLNGKYPNEDESKAKCKNCMSWNTYHMDRPIKIVQMMLRSNDNEDDWES